MKKRYFLTLFMILTMLTTSAFAAQTRTLDDVIGGSSGASTSTDITTPQDVAPADENQQNQQVDTQNTDNSGYTDEQSSQKNTNTVTSDQGSSTGANYSETHKSNIGFINSIKDAGDLAKADVKNAAPIMAGAKKVAAFIVTVVSYIVIAFLAVRVVLDVAYISLPFARGILGEGSAATNQGGVSNNMGMGGGYGGMGGGYGGMGGGYGGMGMGNSYGRYGGGGRGQKRHGITGAQLISNAAITAVAAEGAGAQEGPSPYKIYAKDMATTLIVTPILLVLAATGVLTSLGFIIGNALVDGIAKIGGLI